MLFNEHQRQRLTELYQAIDAVRVLEVAQALGFSAERYLQSNPDLNAAGLDADAATYHYLSGGALVEQRRFDGVGNMDDQAWLDALQALPDLAATSPAMHALAANLFFNRMLGGKSAWCGETRLPEFLDLCRRKAITPLLVIGDSHSHPYSIPHATDTATFVPIHVLCTGGSAAGLANAHSISQYGNKIQRLFEARAGLVREHHLPCFFKFGQVDAEFVWNFRRIKHGQADWSFAGFDAFAAESTAHYLDFVQRVCSDHGLTRHARVLSIFPPTLSDATWRSGYVNISVSWRESGLSLEGLADQVKLLTIPSLQDRTRMHLSWNDHAMRECASRGLQWVDDCRPLLGPDGVVDRGYMIGNDGRDHHLPLGPLSDRVKAVFARNAAVGGA